jgi:hypothetical protein
MGQCLYVEQVSWYFIFSRKMTLTHSIETYLPQNLEEWSPKDVAMQEPMVLTETEDSTPKPKSKRDVITKLGSEDNDSQIDDDDFKTPKALQRRSLRVIFSSDNDSDGNRNTNNRARFSRDKYNEEIEYGSGDSEQDIREHKKTISKISKQDDVQKSKTIDLTKVQKSATGMKEKRVFRKGVDERRVQLAGKQEVC